LNIEREAHIAGANPTHDQLIELKLRSSVGKNAADVISPLLFFQPISQHYTSKHWCSLVFIRGYSASFPSFHSVK
jgi:hypothetical protein